MEKKQTGLKFKGSLNISGLKDKCIICTVHLDSHNFTLGGSKAQRLYIGAILHGLSCHQIWNKHDVVFHEFPQI